MLLFPGNGIRRSAMSENKAFFDANLLLETAENDGAWARELLEMFRKDTAERIEAVRSILRENEPDPEMIRIHFHTIKSSAGTVGATALKDIAFELEQASINRDVELIKKTIPKFEDMTRKSIEEFEKAVKRAF